MPPFPRFFRLAATAALAAAAGGLGAWAATPSTVAPDEAGRSKAAPAALAFALVATRGGGDQAGYDGVVEAVRQTVIASQVSGAVVAIDVKAGDRVRPGQVLLRLDARAAEQTAAAGDAQVRAARALQEAATREFERQKLLFEQKYISRAALDQAEARYKATQAEAAAQLASAGAARTQSGFFVVRAPYAGVVADVGVVLGDMAMPGRALLTVYDPAALRVSAAIPASVVPRLTNEATPQAEVPGAGGRIAPVRMQLLPTLDPATHTRELRLDLPPGLPGLVPGMFARAWLPLAEGVEPRLMVPARSVLRRAELTAVYVIGADGRPLLRQVRLGRAEGDQVEVLSGLSAGERVALDPQAATRFR